MWKKILWTIQLKLNSPIQFSLLTNGLKFSNILTQSLNQPKLIELLQSGRMVLCINDNLNPDWHKEFGVFE